MKKMATVLLVVFMVFVSSIAVGFSEPTTVPGDAEKTYTPEELLSIWNQLGSMLKENGYYPYVELQKGDKGYEVRLLQIRLAQLNYYSKAIADVFGSGTFAGMKQFERVNGLHVDGIASIYDQQLLFSSKAFPNTGASVYEDDEDSSVTTTPAPTSGGINWPNVIGPKKPFIPDFFTTPAPTIDLSDLYEKIPHKIPGI